MASPQSTGRPPWDQRFLDRISRDSYPGRARDSRSGKGAWQAALHLPLALITALAAGTALMWAIVGLATLALLARLVRPRWHAMRGAQASLEKRPHPFGG